LHDDGPLDIKRIDVGVVDDGLLCVIWLDDPDENAGLTLDRNGALELARRLIEVANMPIMSLPVPP
jgi:hypothetical protein